MHGFPEMKYGKEVGETLTKFAALVVKMEFKLKQQETYHVMSSSADEYVAQNVRQTKTTPGKEYSVNKRKGHLECDCYINYSLCIALPAHIGSP